MAENTISIILEAHSSNFHSGMQSAVHDMNGMHSGLGKVGSAMSVVKTGALAAGAAFIAMGGMAALGIGKAIKAGMDLEQQMVSMRHFIKNSSAPGTTELQVSKMTDDYIGWLRNNANVTPFETNEVVQSGARAINISGGDMGKAKEMVGLAEDMAALNPGKSISDAMEAIADAKMGEFERMKEFGFKLNQKSFKDSGGDVMKMKNSEGQGIADFYKGGAQELSETAAGKSSTVTGIISSTFSDMGMAILDSGFKESLGELTTFIDSNSGKFTEFANVVGGVIGKGFTMFKDIVKSAAPFVMDTLEKLASTFGESFGWIAGEQDFLKQVMQDGWSAIKEIISVVGIPTIEASIKLLGSAVHGVYVVFKDAWPVITTYVSATWTVVKPIFELMFAAIDKVVGVVNKLIKAFEGLSKYGLSGMMDSLGINTDSTGGVTYDHKRVTKEKQADVGGIPKKKKNNANGTSYFSGGLTWVGERGPELLSLPTGSQIIPNHKTKQYAGQQKGAAPVININIPKLADRIDANSPDDVDRMAERLFSYVMDKMEKDLSMTYKNFGGVTA